MRVLISLGLLTLCACSLEAQEADIRVAMKRYLDAVRDNDQTRKDDATLELHKETLRRELARLAQANQASVDRRAFRRAQLLAESRRLDRQTAGEAGNSGTTAIAALPSVTELLSAALESGIVNRTTDGSVATLRLNASALVSAFAPEEPCFLRSAACAPTLSQRLKGFSLGVSFDQSQPEAADPNATGTLNPGGAPLPQDVQIPGLARVRDFRSFTARWQFRGRRSLEDADRQQAWKEAMAQAREEAQNLGLSLTRFEETLDSDEAWRAWRRQSEARLDAIAQSNRSDAEKLEEMTRAFQADVRTFLDSAQPALTASAGRVMENLSTFRAKRNELLHEVLYPTRATLEYLYQRPLNQPEFSTVRFIIGKAFGEQGETRDAGAEGEAPLSQFTFNFAGSVYHNPPPGVGAFRDAQAAIQLSRFLPVQTGAHQKAVFSVAGYYQYLAQKGVLNFDEDQAIPFVGIPLPQSANLLLDTKGSIFVAQAKLTIPLGDSGVNFPVAVSWANRAELIKADYTKLQFGLTFDLKQLLTGLAAREP